MPTPTARDKIIEKFIADFRRVVELDAPISGTYATDYLVNMWKDLTSTPAPRKPTSSEYHLMAAALCPETNPTANDMAATQLRLLGSHCAIFDTYISDGPGYTGRVAVVVWGEPELVSVVTFDGRMGVEGTDLQPVVPQQFNHEGS